MTMKLSEAIRLGGLLKGRKRLSGWSGDPRACALQLAALAVGQNDLANMLLYDTPNYQGIEHFFKHPDGEIIHGVWMMNDAVRHDGTFIHSLEEIADWVEQEERKLGLWDEVDGKATAPEAEIVVA